MADLILFAIISAFVGVYTLFPEHRQARLNFSIGPLAQCLGLLALLTIVIAVLIGSFVTDSNSFIIAPELLAVDHLKLGQIFIGIQFIAEVVQILVVLSVSVYLFYLLSSTSVRVSDWVEFGSKVREYRDNRDYPQLADLLDDHYDRLFYLGSDVPDEVEGAVEEAVMNKKFITTCASSRPEFLLRLITDRKVDLVDRGQLSDIFIRYLITNQDSLLYSEIRNLEKLHGYAHSRIPARYRVLSNLFEDCSLEQDLSIARSIGEPTIDYLRGLPDGKDDPYNTRDTRFSTAPSDAVPSVYEDRVYIAIQYFNLAVREALHQDHHGHMWMHYYDYFTQEICDNYEQVSQATRPDEWESDYQYLIQEIVDNTTRWIAVPELYWYSGDFVLNNNKKSVIQSAIDVLFRVHQQVLTCNNVPSEFKQKISHSIINTYFDLMISGNSDSNTIGDMMKSQIAGVTSGNDQKTIEYKRQFASHLSTADIDYLYYSGTSSDARDVRDELEQILQ